jgi:hypothetical protein
LGLLYASNEYIKMQNDASKEAEMKQKINDGKVKMYFKKPKG